MPDLTRALVRLRDHLSSRATLTARLANAYNANDLLREKLAETRAALAGLIAAVRADEQACPEQARPERTFTFRPAGEDADATVALRSLGRCVICPQDIPAGSFVVLVDDGPPWPKAWAHESCARPGQPARPPLNADQHTARP